MVLLNDDALLASTNVFIPFIIIPPMAAMPWIIANVGIAHLFFFPSPDVTGPCPMIFNLFGKSASKVWLILRSNLFCNLITMSISWKLSILKSVANDLMQFVIICWCVI